MLAQFTKLLAFRRVRLTATVGWVLSAIIILSSTATAVAQPATYLPWEYGASYKVTQGNDYGGHNDQWKRYGWDFAMPSGTPVVAAASGRVTLASYGWNYGWGNVVVVCYGDGSCSRYGHLTAIDASVAAGREVSRTQRLGTVGSTGNSTGPHLHYQLENSNGISVGSSFAEAGVPVTGQVVTSRNRIEDPRPVFDDFRVYSSDTLDVTAGDSVRAVVTARYLGPKPIPCGQANFGVRGDVPAKFADASAGWWPKSPWWNDRRVAAVGCDGYLDPGEKAEWALTFQPPVTTPSGTYRTGVYAPVWEGVAWSDAQVPISLRVAARYEAAFVEQSISPLTKPGETGRLVVAMKNVGISPWRRDEVFLGTRRDTAFPYADSSWGANRNRVRMREDVVNRGEVAHFEATFAPGSDVPPAGFRQYFGLVLEGKGWFADEMGIYLPVFVGDKDRLPFQADDYAVKWVKQTYAQSPLGQGETVRLTVTYRNTGLAVLFADGQRRVNLRGIRPQDRRSGFIDVSDPLSVGDQGVRLPVERVDPGEEFTFTVPVKVASWTKPGSYDEYFRPVAEGFTWFGPTDVYWPLTAK